jgi:tetratricopeptide (TPR) repeat protein
MRSEERIQNSGFRIQNRGRKPALWMALGAAVLAAGCAGPKAPQFTDADWVSHSTTGRGAYERGDYRRAAEAYARAQQRARALDEADALAIAAASRAVCLLADGQAGEALAAVQEALADARVSGARQAELQVAGARAQVALGHPGEAMALADAALKLNPSARVRAQALLAQGAVSLAQGQSAAAAKVLEAGMSAKDWGRLPVTIRAERAALLGRVAAAEGRAPEAVAGHDEAAGLWKRAGRLPDMAQALAEAGRQAQAAGDAAGAGDRLFRAARSLEAQGLEEEAQDILREAEACTEALAAGRK